jgi:hypothetical protein
MVLFWLLGESLLLEPSTWKLLSANVGVKGKSVRRIVFHPMNAPLSNLFGSVKDFLGEWEILESNVVYFWILMKGVECFIECPRCMK